MAASQQLRHAGAGSSMQGWRVPRSAMTAVVLATLAVLAAMLSVHTPVAHASSNPLPFPNNKTRYDYIVVGSGAGGGPLACNLARKGWKVLLIESGSNYTSDNASVPIHNALSVEDPGQAFDYRVKHYDGGPDVQYPRAGVLGGCTQHHALIAHPPHKVDFEEIAQLTGDSSWDPIQMRQHWKSIENCSYSPYPGNPNDHGYRGWMPTAQVNLAKPPLELDSLITIPVLSFQNVSKGKLNDYFDPFNYDDTDKEGHFIMPTMTYKGKRYGVREFIMDTVRRFPDNLHVMTNTHVTRVIITPDTKVAVGVQYTRSLNNEQLYGASPMATPPTPGNSVNGSAFVQREVIISAGAFNTPQILMLSGVGPREVLQEKNITVLVDLPGVGANLQDRYEIAVVSSTLVDFNYPCRDLYSWCRESLDKNEQQSILSLNGPVLGVTRKSNASLPAPDMFLFGSAGNFTGYRPGWSRDENLRLLHDRWTYLLLKAHTQNRAGFVKIQSKDPFMPPNINFRYFQEGADEDLNALVQGFKLMREMADVVRNESLKAGLPSSLFAEELYPGPSVQTDAEVEQHIRDTTWGHHACCTAKIGKQEDPMAVLDSNFRVYGVRNLRVVDASVFPKIPGMFITVPILVTSQKASAAIDAQALDACRDSPYCMSSDDDSGLSRQNIGAIVGGILAFIGLALSLLYALSDKFRNKKKDAEVSARAQAQFEADRARQRAATKDRITLLGKEKEGAIDSDTLAINVTPAEARARVMFAELDRDNDGYIERHTLRAALSAASGIPLDEVVSDDVNKLLEDEPLAVDGKVSLQEFLRIRDRHVSITVPDSRANGSSMLFTPTDVYFENITLDYVDPKTQESNRVLHNLTGYIAPGTMTALLGSSGAGKSTMLDVLSMRKNTGNVEGRVLINGHERNSSFYKMSSYVPQEDLFLPTVTVREVVMYYATLRMPAYATPAARWRRCEMLLLESGLLEYVDSKVGGPLPGGITVRGLSGGQKRRLSMVCGLIANPAILFLDEVTSGLDALSALMVMEMIRRLATQGLTIIATIHQPRTSIWRMFDKVMLLANGRLMYMGDASRATEWFNSLGYPTDPQANPADFLLDLTSISFHKDPALFGNKTMRKLEHVEDAADAFAKSEHMALLRRQQKFVSYSRGVDQTLELMTRFGKDKDAKMQSSLWRRVIESSRKMAGNAEHQSMAPWGTQFGVLLKRAITNYVRNPGNVIARFVLVAFTGFMTGAAFFGLSEHWDALNSRLGALYFLCVIYVLLPFTSLSLFIYDRQFYSRESAARLYTPSAYYLANSLVELTFNAANVAISASVAYWMIDLGLSDNILGAERNANGFWVFLRIMTLLHIVGNQMVQLCGLMMPNQDMAFALGAGFVILCQIFSGFLVIPSNFNEVTEWLQYTSFLKYAYAGVVLNEFEGYDANSDPSFSIIEEAHFSNPTTVADNQYVLLGFFFVFHIMAFLCLKYLHKERR